MNNIEDEIRELVKQEIRQHDFEPPTQRENMILDQLQQLQNDINKLKEVFGFIFDDKPST